MSHDGIQTVLWGPEGWGLKKAITGQGAKPTPIPTAPTTADPSVEAAIQAERKKNARGGQGSTIYAGVLSPDQGDAVKKKTLLGGV